MNTTIRCELPDVSGAHDLLVEGTSRLCALYAMHNLGKQVQAGLDMDPDAAMDDARVTVAQSLEGLARSLRTKGKKESAGG